MKPHISSNGKTANNSLITEEINLHQ